jgi:hypothetical protein
MSVSLEAGGLAIRTNTSLDVSVLSMSSSKVGVVISAFFDDFRLFPCGTALSNCLQIFPVVFRF